MKYRILPVARYEGKLPTHYGTDGWIDLSLDHDIVSVPHSVAYSIDVFQAKAAVVKIGKIKLGLNNNDGRWTPGVRHFANSDRDHVLQIEDDSGTVIWRGFVRETELVGNAVIHLSCVHDLDRLDDIMVAGDDNEGRAAIPASAIFDEVRGQMPDLPRPGDIASWYRVFRPKQAVSARTMISRILTAQRKVMYQDGRGRLVVGDFGPVSRMARHPVKMTVDEVLDVKVLDDKDRMYNAIRYRPHGADDDVVYIGAEETYRAPGSFLYRYGARELALDMTHLSATDAAAAAKAWQGLAITPKRRTKIKFGLWEMQKTVHIQRYRTERTRVTETVNEMRTIGNTSNNFFIYGSHRYVSDNQAILGDHHNYRGQSRLFAWSVVGTSRQPWQSRNRTLKITFRDYERNPRGVHTFLSVIGRDTSSMDFFDILGSNPVFRKPRHRVNAQKIIVRGYGYKYLADIHHDYRGLQVSRSSRRRHSYFGYYTAATVTISIPDNFTQIFLLMNAQRTEKVYVSKVEISPAYQWQGKCLELKRGKFPTPKKSYVLKMAFSLQTPCASNSTTSTTLRCRFTASSS